MLLYKTYTTASNRHYVYDAPTGRILECDELTTRMLSLYRQGKAFQQISEIMPDTEESELAMRDEQIRVSRESEGLFTDGRFTQQNVGRKGMFQKLTQLVLNVTDDCNLRCGYCVFGENYPQLRQRQPNRMSLQTALAAIEHVVRLRGGSGTLINLSFFGGEPFLETRLIRSIVTEIAVRHQDQKFRIGATTNGTLMNLEILDLCLETDMDLTISLDGPKDIHDRYRKGLGEFINGSFDRIMETLAYICQNAPEYFQAKLGFTCTIAPPFENARRAEFFGQCPDLPDQFMLRVTEQIWNGLTQEQGSVLIDSYRKEWGQDWETYKQIVARPDFSKEERWARGNLFWNSLFSGHFSDVMSRGVYDHPVYNLLRGECLPHWSRLFASPEGDFYPCIPATYFADRRFKVGDVVQGVDQERVAEISNSFQEVRQTRCSVCWAAPLCGECFAMFSWEDPEANCHRRRSHYADCLRNATELVELRPELVKVFSTDRTVVDDVSGDELLTSPS